MARGKCREKRLHCLSVMSMISSERGYVASSGSPVMRVIRQQLARRNSSSMNSADSEHQAPLVSTAMGTNKWVDVMMAHFVVFFTADFSADTYAETDVDGMCDAA